MLRAAMAAVTTAQKKDQQQTHSLGLQESNFQLVQHLLGRILEIRDLRSDIQGPRSPLASSGATTSKPIRNTSV